MSRLLAATSLLVLGTLALSGCVTQDRPFYSAHPAYYENYGRGYYAPPVYAYAPYYGPRSYSTFSLSLGRGRHPHGHHRHRHHHHRWR